MRKIAIFIWYRVIGSFFRVLPIKRNRIVFCSFFGKGFGDSNKYIFEKLSKSGDYDIVWMVKTLDKKDFPEGITVVKRGTLSELYYLSTARVWVDNSRKPFGTKKRKTQFYIQTWHSSLRLKRIERDAERYLDSDYIRAAKNDSRMTDLITSGCRFSTNIYKNSFWYDGEVLECGTARCDMLLDESGSRMLRAAICKRYGIDSSKKLVLYAPTFRRNKIFDSRYLNCGMFAQALGDDYAVIIRLHPNMSGVMVDESIFNATDYPDMQELICAVDYLITDYSGCCFDMMIAKKPCILYTPDLEQYLSGERDLYFSFDELPFEKTTSLSELVNTIKGFDISKYLRNVQLFDKKIGLCEHGNASEVIAEIIAKKCEDKK